MFLEYSLWHMKIIIASIIPKQPNITVTSNGGPCISNAIVTTCGAATNDKVGIMTTLSLHRNELP